MRCRRVREIGASCEFSGKLGRVLTAINAIFAVSYIRGATIKPDRANAAAGVFTGRLGLVETGQHSVSLPNNGKDSGEGPFAATASR